MKREDTMNLAQDAAVQPIAHAALSAQQPQQQGLQQQPVVELKDVHKSFGSNQVLTAKPLPCSPARAASTAALSARILVWNAMPSMTPMISSIFPEDSLRASMVWVILLTTSLPRVAMSDAKRTDF